MDKHGSVRVDELIPLPIYTMHVLLTLELRLSSFLLIRRMTWLIYHLTLYPFIQELCGMNTW